MKTYIKTCIIFVFCTVCLCACDMDEFFKDPRPQESSWVNTTTFDQGVAAAYRGFFQQFLAGYPAMFDYAMNGTSQLLPETSTGMPFLELDRRTFSTQWGNLTSFWNYAYRTITMSNAGIELNDENDSNPFNLSRNSTDYTDNYVRQVGELYFLRAFAYYYLTRFFAAPYDPNGSNSGSYIPFHTKIAKDMNDIKNTPLGTNAEIFEQILSDLRTAKQLLPEGYKNSMLRSYEVGRATQYTAAAMLAKVLFRMGKYSEAERELDFVISAAEGGRYYLDEPIEAFNKLHVAGISREAILEFDAGTPGINATMMNMYAGMVFSLNFRDARGMGRGDGMVKSGWNQWTFSYWLAEKLGWMTDPKNGDYSLTPAALADKRVQQVYYYLLGYKKIDPNNQTNPDYFLYETLDAHAAVRTPQLYVDKYFRGGTLGTTEAGNYTKFPLIRLADIYLIRAWVRWKNGNSAGAADDMNKVWNRANPDNPNIYHASDMNHDAILIEYLREMTGEDWTTDFMMATQMPIPPGDRIGVSPVPPPYTGWHWNIPISEIDMNPNY